jgi:hypothetical protein
VGHRCYTGVACHAEGDLITISRSGMPVMTCNSRHAVPCARSGVWWGAMAVGCSMAC